MDWLWLCQKVLQLPKMSLFSSWSSTSSSSCWSLRPPFTIRRMYIAKVMTHHMAANDRDIVKLLIGSRATTLLHLGNWKSDISTVLWKRKIKFEKEQQSFTTEYWNPTIYNIIRWFAGTNDSMNKCLMFQSLFFFIVSYRLRTLKTLYFYFCKFIEK